MNIELNKELLNGNTANPKITNEKSQSYIEVIADMLRPGKNDKNKKKVSGFTKTDKKQIKKNLNYLINQGLIDQVNVDETVIAYRVTESGLKLLKTIDALTSMLRTANNED